MSSGSPWTPHFEQALHQFAEMIGRRAHYGFLGECESPIEAMFATAFLLTHWCVPGARAVPWWIPSKHPIEGLREDFISPQRRILQFRVDFLVGLDGALVVVECDGHDFHHVNAGQIERDRIRDAKVAAAGYGMCRFTGAQISRDPFGCVAELCTADWRMFQRGRQ